MKSDDEVKDGEDVGRRRFIQATGTAAGIGAISTGAYSVGAKSTNQRVWFVEAGYEHELSGRKTADLDRVHIDEFIPHEIKNSSKIKIRNYSPQAVMNKINNWSNMIRLGSAPDGYNSFPIGEMSLPSSRILTTVLDDSYRSIYGVEVAKPYSPPNIALKTAGKSVDLFSEGIQERIPRGEERSFTLSSQEVDVLSSVKTGKTKTSDQKGEKQEEVQIEELTQQQVKATPSLIIRNYGKLEVVE